MKAKIRRVWSKALVPDYSKLMAAFGARLCGRDGLHWAEAEISSIEKLMKIVDETNCPVIVGWDNTEKTCLEITIYDDYGAW